MNADGKQNLPGYGQQLEANINQEFQQVLRKPGSAAKRAAFKRMDYLIKKRRADYVKALEGLWGPGQ